MQGMRGKSVDTNLLLTKFASPSKGEKIFKDDDAKAHTGGGEIDFNG